MNAVSEKLKKPAKRPKYVDLKRIWAANYRSKQSYDGLIDKALAAREDRHRYGRLRAMRCKACFYFPVNRLAGQAFTARPCHECGEEILHHNTAVPPICKKCAKRLGVCLECCADMDFKCRKKLKRK